GVTPTCAGSTSRAKPSRSVIVTTDVATSSADGRRSGAVAGTTPSITVRPDSRNSPTPSSSAAVSVDTSTDTALTLLRRSIVQGSPGAQLCIATPPPIVAIQS